MIVPIEHVVVLIENGILTAPQFQPDQWNDWLGSKIDDETPMKSKVISYFCDAVFKQAKQAERIKILATEIKKTVEVGRFPVLIGHSNGAAIDCGILQKTKLPILQVHLFAGACQEDCRLNGINNAIARQRLGQAFCYCSKSDEVLAKYDSWLLNPVYRALGYGFMGYAGPKNGCIGVREIWRSYAHSGDEAYWGKKHREQTWKLFMDNLQGNLNVPVIF